MLQQHWTINDKMHIAWQAVELCLANGMSDKMLFHLLYWNRDYIAKLSTQKVSIYMIYYIRPTLVNIDTKLPIRQQSSQPQHYQSICVLVVLNCNINSLLKCRTLLLRKYECKDGEWSMGLYPVEVGARGFVVNATTRPLKHLEPQGARLHKAGREISKEAEKSSFWLWLKRRNKTFGASNSWRMLAAGGVRETSLFTAPPPRDVLG